LYVISTAVTVERWPPTFEPVHCTCRTWSRRWADVGQQQHVFENCW